MKPTTAKMNRELAVTNEPNAPRETTPTVPFWRIVVGWGFVALYGVAVLHGLMDGDVVWGRHTKVHYTRSHDPAAYWFTIAFQSLMLGVFIYAMLKTKPEAGEPPKRDLTPRDWMGNRIERK